MSEPRSTNAELSSLLAQLLDFFRGTTNGSAAGLFRIVLGVLSFDNALLLLPNADRYYGPAGTLPWNVVTKFPENRYTLFRFFGEEPDFPRTFLLVLAALSLLYALGVLSRVLSVVCFLMLGTLHHRNPYVINGGDNLMLQLFWLGAFLPLDARFSLTAALRCRFGAGTTDSARYSVVGQRLVMVLVFYIYLYAFGAKMQHRVWWTGEAMIDVLASPMLARFPFVLDFFPLSALMSYGTLVFEGTFPVLVLHPKTRRFTLLAGVAFHLGIDLTLKIPLFSAMMLTSYLAFLEDREVEGALAWVTRFFRPRAPALPADVGTAARGGPAS